MLFFEFESYDPSVLWDSFSHPDSAVSRLIDGSVSRPVRARPTKRVPCERADFNNFFGPDARNQEVEEFADGSAHGNRRQTILSPNFVHAIQRWVGLYKERVVVLIGAKPIFVVGGFLLLVLG